MPFYVSRKVNGKWEAIENETLKEKFEPPLVLARALMPVSCDCGSVKIKLWKWEHFQLTGQRFLYKCLVCGKQFWSHKEASI